MTRLASIWRHPIKAVGREELDRVALREGRALPWDRHWAVTHERSRAPAEGWARKANFLRGVSGPQLMAVTATLDEAAGRVTLRHPDRGEITIDPEAEGARLAAWLGPLWPEDQPRPTGLASCETGYTDAPEPFVSVHIAATHRAVEESAGRALSMHRWRGNLWLDGPDAWAEFDLIGRRLRIGDAVLEVATRITRCKATEANPETGERDLDTLGVLRGWDHQDFGVYALVVEGGTAAVGDRLELL